MGTMNSRARQVSAFGVFGVSAVLATATALGMASWPVLAASAMASATASPQTSQSRAAPADSNAALVAQIASRLGGAKGVRAQFTQTQTLAAMKAPLVSTGSLLFVRERGVIWQIDTPYKATYVITDAGVSEVDATGKRVTSHGAQGARGVAQVSKMMRAMLGGDLSALYSQFDVQAEGSAARWRMRLTPNQPQIAQSIKGLQMNGGEYLQSLRISLANGDTTQLEFSRSETVSEPAPAERSLFGAP